MSTDTDDSFAIPNFQLFRNDQNTITGRRPPHGLAIYVSHKFSNFTTVQHVSTADFEASCISLSNVLLQIISVYKSPSCSFSQLCSKLTAIALEIDLTKPLIIVGDFNFDIWNGKNTSHLQTVSNILGCQQFITEITTDYNSLIDMVFSNEAQVITSTIESSWSDHKILFIAYPTSIPSFDYLTE
jgi:endonuclease/exonuclease/phosphatase (EEP) superfamily protein YafD